jgi:hypothetical protein
MACYGYSFTFFLLLLIIYYLFKYFISTQKKFALTRPSPLNKITYLCWMEMYHTAAINFVV